MTVRDMVFSLHVFPEQRVEFTVKPMGEHPKYFSSAIHFVQELNGQLSRVGDMEVVDWNIINGRKNSFAIYINVPVDDSFESQL